MGDEHGDVRWAREQRDDRILELYAAGWSQRTIAKEVGCSVGLVNLVINR